jgi:hypothetical protein
MRLQYIVLGTTLILIEINMKLLPAITVGKCDNVLLIIIQYRDATLTNIMHTN